jgi:hypothetical protein
LVQATEAELEFTLLVIKP